MSVTNIYTATHLAFTGAARVYGISPADVRLLVAISERGGRARSDELERDLGGGDGGSGVRRSLGVLYAHALAWGSSPGGHPRKRGVRSIVALTDDGRRVVEMALGLRESAIRSIRQAAA